MSSSQLPTSAIPKPLADDDDDVSWALQTAAVQWGRGAYQDALVWLRRAAESAIDISAWSRAADLNATATRLEKQLSKAPLPQPTPQAPPYAGASSAPPRNAILPSFPVPTTSAPPAAGFGELAGGRRQTTGYSSLPPLPRQGSSSGPPSNQGRSSVVIDVEEGELEMSDEEIRALESGALPGSDIPDGARPSWAASPQANADSLPAFSLESSRPSYEPAQRPSSIAAMGRASGLPRLPAPSLPNALPSFPMPASARQTTSTNASASSTVPGQPEDHRTGSSLPSFPLDANASSLPPVSKWPHLGSPGTSRIPPNPALPSFEAPPPSRPFVDDGEDGAPGIEPALDENLLQELEPLDSFDLDGLDRRVGSKVGSGGLQSNPPPLPAPVALPRQAPAPENLDLVEIDAPRSSRGSGAAPGSLGHLPVRSGRASARPLGSAAPLPPALPDGRSKSSKPRLVRAERRPASESPAVVPAASRPPVPSTSPVRSSVEPRVSPSGSIEPRMPKRTLSYASPLDFRAKTDSREPAERSASASPASGVSDNLGSGRVASSAPTERRIEVAEPVSVLPPASARSLEPEDLPTVSSPSLSRPPSGARPRGPSESPDTVARSADARGNTSPAGERRRISFKFEEAKTSSVHPTIPATLAAHAGSDAIPEEALAVLPPVATRPAADSKSPGSADVVLSGVRLAEVRGFSDLPASAHRLLARTARIESLAVGEEASFFSVALVLDGWVGLMPAIADTACATAVVGEVVFTEGSLSDGVMLRVVAGQDDVVVATWDSEAIAEATKDCPWIADDLRLLADGFQALAGACLGPLGDRLDDSLRSIVTSRCEIRTLLPGEQLCAANKPVPGMHIIGGGDIELVDENGRVTKTYGTGEFLFAPQVLAGGVAPYSARAGSKGALVLFAPRMAAHELLVSVPPLLEILAE
jgi:hypothetical protein